MDDRSLSEDRLELVRVHVGDHPRIDRADPTLQLERAAESLLDGDLLIQAEADEEREGLADEQAYGCGCFWFRRKLSS